MASAESPRSPSVNRVVTRVLTTPVRLRTQLAEDVAGGFAQSPKSLPPKYFYDVLGSGIFEAITELPEYYVTRAEAAALELHADEITGRGAWGRLVELGSGSSTKTRMLLESLHRRSGSRVAYVPLDISAGALEQAALALVDWADWVDVAGFVVDFLTADIEKALDVSEPQLAIMLGSTLGNLFPHQYEDLFRHVAASLKPADRFLFGLDLVKDPGVIEPAYNDSAGVTEEFNKNVIRVLQRELGATCRPEDFRHDAPYVTELERIEMRLYASRDLEIHFDASISLPSYEIAEGEYLLTEISQKFRRSGFEAILAHAGLTLDDWWTDPEDQVALALVRRA
jgi:L-histidine N-alpha-methyltransferase